MADDRLVDVTITGPDAEQLAVLTRLLVEARLAAAGNVVNGVRSIYRWQGRIEDTSEALVVLHTRESLVPRIIEETDRHHPYLVPQVLAVPIVGAHPEYRQWVLDSTSPEP